MIKEYHVSENLFDKVSEIQAYYLDSTTGAYKLTSSTSRLALIPIEENTSYTFTVYSRTFRISFFDTQPVANQSPIEFYNLDYGVYGSHSNTFTSPIGAQYVAFFVYNSGTEASSYTEDEIFNTVMVNKGQTALPYEPYGNTWNTKSYCKATTGSKTYSNFPIVVRSREQSISSWNMKGNEQHTGTASPTSPIEINGTGDRTGNHFNAEKVVAGRMDNGVIGYASDTSNVQYSNNVLSFTISKAFRGVTSDLIPIDDVMCISYTLSSGMIKKVAWYASDKSFISQTEHSSQTYPTGMVLTPIENVKYFRISFEPNAAGDYTITNIMLNTGSTALPYIPYGYKIPISANGTALTPVYLTEPLMLISTYADSLASSGTVTRVVKKLVFNGTEAFDKNIADANDYLYWLRVSDSGQTNRTVCSHLLYSAAIPTGGTIGMSNRINTHVLYFNFGADIMNAQTSGNTKEGFKEYLAAQYANGTPVTVYYVIETAITEQVTVPTIPTTSGLNTIDIGTTVKPSEMSLTYDGWRIHKSKRKSVNLCDESIIQNGYYGSTASFSNFTSDNRYRAFSMPIKAGTYTIKIRADEGIRLLRIATANEFYDVQTDNQAYTFIISADATIYVSWRNLNTTNSFTNMTVMLNSGSTTLPYVPYWE